MDANLRRALQQIAEDKTSGASQLARKACEALRERLSRPPIITRNELRAIADLLLSAQPEMAPVIRLALECRRAAGSAAALAQLPRAIPSFAAIGETASTEIARHFLRELSKHGRVRIAMYSYSGTVIHALFRARPRIAEVICAEGRPILEGRRAASELSQAGLRVTLLTDAVWMDALSSASLLAVGADAATEKAFLNKAGTSAAVCCARAARIPIYVLADSTKFLPAATARRWLKVRTQAGPAEEIWEDAPNKVHIVNPYLAWTRWQPGVHWISESGKTSPARSFRRSD